MIKKGEIAMEGFSNGQAVVHDDYGYGHVIYTRQLDEKRLVLVEFEDGYETEVLEEDLH